MPKPADFGGFLYDPYQLSQRNMPIVAKTLRELPTFANGLEAHSYQNLLDLENWF
jgi:hypothetical protein